MTNTILRTTWIKLINCFHEYLLLLLNYHILFCDEHACVNFCDSQNFLLYLWISQSANYVIQICDHQFESLSIYWPLFRRKLDQYILNILLNATICSSPTYSRKKKIKYSTMFHWLINCAEDCFTMMLFCVPNETNCWTTIISRKRQWLNLLPLDIFVP